MDKGAISGATEIVVPLDGRPASARALAAAGRFLERLDCPVRLLSISDDEAETRARLAALAEEMLPGREAVVDVRTADSPADAIVEVAGDSALVCMATAATLRPHAGHIGSVAEAVVRTIRRPVVLIGPRVDAASPIERVIVPVDGSTLAERSLDLAGDVAGTLGVEGWVVSAISHRIEEIAGEQLEHLVASEVGYVKRLASRLAADHGISASFEVLHLDAPASAIADFAANDGVVVMSTHGRSGLSRLLAGSVAIGVVAASRAPVVVWRPDDD